MRYKGRRRRLRIWVTPQAAYNLQRLADMGGCRELGVVVDKLTRDRMVSLRHRQTQEEGEVGKIGFTY